jgi:hypothetical protein
MEKRRGLGWWNALSLRRRAPAAAQIDFADMGTAFGLDASLSPVDEPVQATTSHASADTAAHLARRLHRRSVS